MVLQIFWRWGRGNLVLSPLNCSPCNRGKPKTMAVLRLGHQAEDLGFKIAGCASCHGFS